MAAVRHRGTAPEIAVRGILDTIGLAFEVDCSDLPGTPDLVVSESRTPILVHGCFWHRHSGCKLASTPKSNVAYWDRKFVENQARDKLVMGRLKSLGLRPIAVWECETRDLHRLSLRLARLLRARHKNQPRLGPVS